MNRLTIWLWLLAMCGAFPSYGGSVDNLAIASQARADQINQDNQRWQEQQQAERQALLSDAKALQAKLNQQTAAMTALQQQLAGLTEQRQQLQQAKTEAEADMALVDSSYRHLLSQLQQRWQLSPSQYRFPQRQQWLQQQLGSDGFPSSDALQRLVDYSIGDLNSGAEVHQLEHAIAAGDGRSALTQLTLIGQAMVIGQQAEQLGVVDITQRRLLAPLPADIEQPLQQWLNGNSDLLLLDLSQGSALPSLIAQQSWRDWVADGGQLLWPILALCLVGLITIVGCAVRLLWWRPIPALDATDASQIPAKLQQLTRTPAVQPLLQMWQCRSLEAADQQLKEGMLAQFGRFERGLAFITLLAALAPMLGLLGTVSGMIETFRALTEFGNAEPKLLSSGISKALITTQAGLMSAIPLLLLHHPLKRRAQKLIANMEQQGAQLLAIKLEAMKGPQHG